MPKYIKAKSGPKNSVIYTDSDGKQWIFEGGNRLWRNQNPGDFVPGAVANRNGTMLQVRKEMGTPDSYFFSDTIFAYEITPPGENKESWHLIFIPDEKLEKVKEVRIHKKCCYKSPL